MEHRGPFKAVTKYRKHRLISEADGKEIAIFHDSDDAQRFARIVNEADKKAFEEYERRFRDKSR